MPKIRRKFLPTVRKLATYDYDVSGTWWRRIANASETIEIKSLVSQGQQIKLQISSRPAPSSGNISLIYINHCAQDWKMAVRDDDNDDNDDDDDDDNDDERWNYRETG